MGSVRGDNKQIRRHPRAQPHAQPGSVRRAAAITHRGPHSKPDAETLEIHHNSYGTPTELLQNSYGNPTEYLPSSWPAPGPSHAASCSPRSIPTLQQPNSPRGKHAKTPEMYRRCIGGVSEVYRRCIGPTRANTGSTPYLPALFPPCTRSPLPTSPIPHPLSLSALRPNALPTFHPIHPTIQQSTNPFTRQSIHPPIHHPAARRFATRHLSHFGNLLLSRHGSKGIGEFRILAWFR